MSTAPAHMQYTRARDDDNLHSLGYPPAVLLWRTRVSSVALANESCINADLPCYHGSTAITFDAEAGYVRKHASRAVHNEHSRNCVNAIRDISRNLGQQA